MGAVGSSNLGSSGYPGIALPVNPQALMDPNSPMNQKTGERFKNMSPEELREASKKALKDYIKSNASKDAGKRKITKLKPPPPPPDEGDYDFGGFDYDA